MVGLGLLGIAGLALPTTVSRSTLSWWILDSALSPQRVLPLVGLGFGLALTGRLGCAAAAVLGVAGIAAGHIYRDGLLSLLGHLPGAAAHIFLTGPVASLAAGLALILPDRPRGWLLPLAAGVIGAMLALAIKLTDPSFHDPTISWAGIAVALWIVAAVFLTVRAFRQPWFGIAGRIAGSWLLAIGLLYGGAALMPGPQRMPAEAPAPTPAPGQSAPPAPITPPFPDGNETGPARPPGAPDLRPPI